MTLGFYCILYDANFAIIKLYVYIRIYINDGQWMAAISQSFLNLHTLFSSDAATILKISLENMVYFKINTN